MEDYIQILLDYLTERREASLGWNHRLQSDRVLQAMEALEETLTDSQKKLFAAYEDTRDEADAAGEMALARQAFLLAREIYR